MTDRKSWEARLLRKLRAMRRLERERRALPGSLPHPIRSTNHGVASPVKPGALEPPFPISGSDHPPAAEPRGPGP